MIISKLDTYYINIQLIYIFKALYSFQILKALLDFQILSSFNLIPPTFDYESFFPFAILFPNFHSIGQQVAHLCDYRCNLSWLGSLGWLCWLFVIFLCSLIGLSASVCNLLLQVRDDFYRGMSTFRGLKCEPISRDFGPCHLIKVKVFECFTFFGKLTCYFKILVADILARLQCRSPLKSVQHSKHQYYFWSHHFVYSDLANSQESDQAAKSI